MKGKITEGIGDKFERKRLWPTAKFFKLLALTN